MSRTQSSPDWKCVSSNYTIAENAQAHRDQPALFSNEKNETNSISLLTTHKVSRGDGDALIVYA